MLEHNHLAADVGWVELTVEAADPGFGGKCHLLRALWLDDYLNAVLINREAVRFFKFIVQRKCYLLTATDNYGGR